MTNTSIVTIAGCAVPATIHNNKGYFSPRAMSDALGLDWSRQRKKIAADPVLSQTVAFMPTVAADGKNRNLLMLPIDMAPGWLFSIKRAKPEVQNQLNRFRLEAFTALDAWFNKGMRNDEEVLNKFNIPQTYAEALRRHLESVEQLEQANQKITLLEIKAEENQEKADWYDELMASNGAWTATQHSHLPCNFSKSSNHSD
ncbi:phage antirepressor N-terminal domain-containing protein [Terasakiella pusilla]|uniref:phage antirepressor N-terminal domain-containing protein n=1 Tax=Terasakiella pusilla TaxID=64973 RepID=UPI003AA86AFB